MKATKFTLAASVAFATLLAAGATASADVTTVSNDTDVTLKAQNGEMSTIPGAGGEDTSSTIPGGGGEDTSSTIPPRPGKEVYTYYRDTEGKDIVPGVQGIHGTNGVDIPNGYVLLGTSVDANNNLIHTYTSKTTINFTAQFNDSRPNAQYSWTFPANTTITYRELFNMAGLDPNEFDLTGQDWNGQTGSNATVVASNAEAVEQLPQNADVPMTPYDSNIDADASINTGEGGSETNIVVSQKPSSSSSSVSSSSSSKPSSSSSNNNDDNGAAPTLPNTGEAEQAGLAIAGLSLMGATVALAATRRRF